MTDRHYGQLQRSGIRSLGGLSRDTVLCAARQEELRAQRSQEETGIQKVLGVLPRHERPEHVCVLVELAAVPLQGRLCRSSNGIQNTGERLSTR